MSLQIYAPTPPPLPRQNPLTSTNWYHWSMGLRGFANMAVQCSLPGPSASLPTRHIPMTSLCPILYTHTHTHVHTHTHTHTCAHEMKRGRRKETSVKELPE